MKAAEYFAPSPSANATSQAAGKPKEYGCVGYDQLPSTPLKQEAASNSSQPARNSNLKTKSSKWRRWPKSVKAKNKPNLKAASGVDKPATSLQTASGSLSNEDQADNSTGIINNLVHPQIKYDPDPACQHQNSYSTVEATLQLPVNQLVLQPAQPVSQLASNALTMDMQPQTPLDQDNRHKNVDFWTSSNGQLSSNVRVNEPRGRRMQHEPQQLSTYLDSGSPRPYSARGRRNHLQSSNRPSATEKPMSPAEAPDLPTAVKDGISAEHVQVKLLAQPLTEGPESLEDMEACLGWSVTSFRVKDKAGQDSLVDVILLYGTYPQPVPHSAAPTGGEPKRLNFIYWLLLIIFNVFLAAKSQVSAWATPFLKLLDFTRRTCGHNRTQRLPAFYSDGSAQVLTGEARRSFQLFDSHLRGLPPEILNGHPLRSISLLATYLANGGSVNSANVCKE
jgi:hypothetical protein